MPRPRAGALDQIRPVAATMASPSRPDAHLRALVVAPRDRHLARRGPRSRGPPRPARRPTRSRPRGSGGEAGPTRRADAALAPHCVSTTPGVTVVWRRRLYVRPSASRTRPSRATSVDACRSRGADRQDRGGGRRVHDLAELVERCRQVEVAEGGIGGRRHRQAGGHGGALPLVAPAEEPHGPADVGDEGIGERRRRIGAPVVDEDELAACGQAGDEVDEQPGVLGEALGLVEQRHHESQRRRHRSAPAGTRKSATVRVFHACRSSA